MPSSGGRIEDLEDSSSDSAPLAPPNAARPPPRRRARSTPDEEEDRPVAQRPRLATLTPPSSSDTGHDDGGGGDVPPSRHRYLTRRRAVSRRDPSAEASHLLASAVASASEVEESPPAPTPPNDAPPLRRAAARAARAAHGTAALVAEMRARQRGNVTAPIEVDDTEDGDADYDASGSDSSDGFIVASDDDAEADGRAGRVPTAAVIEGFFAGSLSDEAHFSEWCRFLLYSLVDPCFCRRLRASVPQWEGRRLGGGGAFASSGGTGDASETTAAAALMGSVRRIESIIVDTLSMCAASGAWTGPSVSPALLGALLRLPLCRATPLRAHDEDAAPDRLGCGVCGRAGHAATWEVRLEGRPYDPDWTHLSAPVHLLRRMEASAKRDRAARILLEGLLPVNEDEEADKDDLGDGLGCGGVIDVSGDHGGTLEVDPDGRVVKVTLPAGSACRVRLGTYHALWHFHTHVVRHLRAELHRRADLAAAAAAAPEAPEVPALTEALADEVIEDGDTVTVHFRALQLLVQASSRKRELGMGRWRCAMHLASVVLIIPAHV